MNNFIQNLGSRKGLSFLLRANGMPQFILATFLIIILVGGLSVCEIAKDKAYAADSDSQTPTSLPRLLVGSSKITSGSATYYGGMQGNYSVLNYGTPADFGFQSNILSCMNTGIINMPACFILGGGTSNAVRMISGQTSFTIGADTNVILETPILVYGPGTIIGDTFGIGVSNLGNFNYWGDNLSATGGNLGDDSGATWKLPNYTLNPNAQMAWDGTSNNPAFGKFDDKLQNLASSAVLISSGDLSNQPIWNLCGSTINAAYNSEISCKSYPEGKVWAVDGDLTLAASAKFQGIGTIIVSGNIYIDKDVSIEPMDKNADRIGFVAGDYDIPEAPVEIPAVSTAGLLGHWKMDDSAGNSDVVDSSGQNITCMHTTGVHPDIVAANNKIVSGKTGTALSFDGINDRVDCHDQSAKVKISTAGTISLWFKLSQFPASGGWYHLAGQSTGGDDFDLLVGGDKKLYFYVDGSRFVSTDALTLDNQWHHVVATYGPSTPQSIYLDNGAPATGAIVSRGTDTNTNPFTIGFSVFWPVSSTGGRLMNGAIDEVRLYNRALSVDEVNILFTNP